jgi:rRNA maturation RNase YbeY
MNEINIFNECKDIDFHKDHIIQLINLSLKATKYNQVKINLIFCDNDKLNSFKRKYFDDDVLTEIVTFPIKNDNDLEAEIYISIEMAKINADEFNVSLNNELSRLIIHGVLHLIGFNDNTKDARKIMFSKQEEIISNFQKDICCE